MLRKISHLDYILSKKIKINYLIMLLTKKREIFLKSPDNFSIEFKNKLKKIFKKEKYNIEKIVIGKRTYRSFITIELDLNGKKYLLNIATNKKEKFYMNRIIENMNKINYEKIEKILPIKYSKNESWILYEKVFGLDECLDKELLYQMFLEKNKKNLEIKINDLNIKKILNEMLKNWPKLSKEKLSTLNEYIEYSDCLKKYIGEKIKIDVEHGDFTKNNVLKKNDRLYLLDFEFVKFYQPIWFDYYDYMKSINENLSEEIPEMYREISEKKYLLYEKLNVLIDKGVN